MQNGGSVSAFYWSSLIFPFSSSYLFIWFFISVSPRFDRFLFSSSHMCTNFLYVISSVRIAITGFFDGILFLLSFWVLTGIILVCYCLDVYRCNTYLYSCLNNLLYHNLI